MSDDESVSSPPGPGDGDGTPGRSDKSGAENLPPPILIRDPENSPPANLNVRFAQEHRIRQIGDDLEDADTFKGALNDRGHLRKARTVSKKAKAAKLAQHRSPTPDVRDIFSQLLDASPQQAGEPAAEQDSDAQLGTGHTGQEDTAAQHALALSKKDRAAALRLLKDGDRALQEPALAGHIDFDPLGDALNENIRSVQPGLGDRTGDRDKRHTSRHQRQPAEYEPRPPRPVSPPLPHQQALAEYTLDTARITHGAPPATLIGAQEDAIKARRATAAAKIYRKFELQQLQQEHDTPNQNRGLARD
jgi:hypothetical protein